MATTVFSTQMLEFKGGRLSCEVGEITIGPEPLVIGRDPACTLVGNESGIS